MIFILKKTLYGIQHIPLNFFNKLTSTLKYMALEVSLHDPLVYMFPQYKLDYTSKTLSTI